MHCRLLCSLGKKCHETRYALTIKAFDVNHYVLTLVLPKLLKTKYLTSLLHISHSSVELLVISKNGASGDYPRCTDLAYQAAIADGADVIDCPVQMSRDGVPFCFSSINLIDGTTIVQTNYSDLTLNIPELSANDAIYPFNMTWDQIASLTRKTNFFSFSSSVGPLIIRCSSLFYALLL